MTAVPPSTTPDSGPATPERRAADDFGRKWAVLHDAAGVVAALAGREAEGPGAGMPGLPALMRDAAAWRRDLAAQGIDDMTAMMQPGIAALLEVNAGGADPRPAAQALWREFASARAAVLALVGPDEAAAGNV